MTTTAQTSKPGTKYQIAYELGGRGSRLHRTLLGAARALRAASRAAARDGGEQCVRLVVVEHTEANPYGIERPLGTDELTALGEVQAAL